MGYRDDFYRVFIKDYDSSIFTEDEKAMLQDNFQEFHISQLSTWSFLFKFYPTYIMLNNRFRIPDLWGNNKTHFEDELLLSDFMTIDEIKTLTYFEYAEEKIYAIKDQLKSLEISEQWEFADFVSSNDMLTVSKALLKYLETDNLKTDINKADVVNELLRINMLAELALRHNLDLCVVPEEVYG